MAEIVVRKCVRGLGSAFSRAPCSVLWFPPIRASSQDNWLWELKERLSYFFLGWIVLLAGLQGQEKWPSPSSACVVTPGQQLCSQQRDMLEVAWRPADLQLPVAIGHSASWLCAPRFNPQMQEQKQKILEDGKPKGKELSAFPALVLPWRVFFYRSKQYCSQIKKVK